MNVVKFRAHAHVMKGRVRNPCCLLHCDRCTTSSRLRLYLFEVGVNTAYSSQER